MEVLTGVSVALLTIYDMCKAIDRTMELSGIHLEEKKAEKADILGGKLYESCNYNS